MSLRLWTLSTGEGGEVMDICMDAELKLWSVFLWVDLIAALLWGDCMDGMEGYEFMITWSRLFTLLTTKIIYTLSRIGPKQNFCQSLMAAA